MTQMSAEHNNAPKWSSLATRENYLSSLIGATQRILESICRIFGTFLDWWREHLPLAKTELLYVRKVTLHYDLCWPAVETLSSVQEDQHTANLVHIARCSKT